MEHAAQGGDQETLLWSRNGLLEPGASTQCRPGAPRPVHVFELRARCFEELSQAEIAGLAEFHDEPVKSSPDRKPDVLEDDLPRNAVQFDMAPRRQEAEAILDVPLRLLASAPRHCLEPSVKAKLGPLATDEIEDGQDSLPPDPAHSAPELLPKEGRALGGSEEEDGVYLRDVNALIEDVDGKHHVEISPPKAPQRILALIRFRCSGDRNCRDAGFVELPGHEPRVLDAHTEP